MAKKTKLVLVSGLQPSGHYTQNLASGLAKLRCLDLVLYSDKNKENLKIKNKGKIKLVWSKNIFYVFQIIWELLKDKPDIVHFQHEINMFGGLVSAFVFPVVVVLAKILGFKVLVTIHATVSPKQINSDFVESFNKNPKIIKPFILKLFFFYLYYSLCNFSDAIIVHTRTARDVLLQYDQNSKNKIFVIPTAIPNVKFKKIKEGKYFFYFGYIARRKGLENLINGFRSFTKKHPKSVYKLFLAGGVIKGQEESLKEIKRLIGSSKKIRYLGFLNQKRQDILYQKAYAVTIPAKLSISASGPLYHALSHGKFIIASKVGHLKDEIIDQENGLLIKNSQWAKAFAVALKEHKLVHKIEKNNLALARIRSPHRTAKKYLKIYEKFKS